VRVWCRPGAIVKREIGVGRLAAAVASALLASAAALPSDAAAGVEYGRCLEVAAGAGAFQDSGCTERGESGKFEWYPGFEGSRPIAKTGFSVTNEERAGATGLAVVKPGLHEEKSPIQCDENFGTGNLSGPHSWAGVKLTLTGFCKKLFNFGPHTFSAQCSTTPHSEAAREAGHEPREGEINLDTLRGEVGATKTMRVIRVGVALFPQLQPYFGETNCGNVRGSQIFALTPNEMRLSTVLKPLNDVSHRRLPREKLEALPRNVLEIETSADHFKQAHLSFADSVTFEEPVELRYCPRPC
jgi:hypothetical protein